MTPAQTYYQSCVGTWRAPMQITITSTSKLRRALGVMNATAMRMMAKWPATLGRTEVRTSVAMLGDDEVEHTTRFMIQALELVSTTETIRLHEDGRSFTIIGISRTLLDSSGSPITGKGEVAEDAASATYELTFMGSRLDQRTTREEDVVTLYWDGPGYTGVQRLQRQ